MTRMTDWLRTFFIKETKSGVLFEDKMGLWGHVLGSTGVDRELCWSSSDGYIYKQ
jgi:hypothetical protein